MKYNWKSKGLSLVEINSIREFHCHRHRPLVRTVSRKAMPIQGQCSSTSFISDQTSVTLANKMKFDGVQNFLDRYLKDRQASEIEIIQAKKDYWRLYNTALKRRIRKEYPILRIRFTQNEMQLLKKKLHEKELLSVQVRRIVLRYLENDENLNPNNVLMEQQLFLISDYLEELLEEGDVVSVDKVERLQGYIVAVQDALEGGG